jgi:hypothetical protein
MPLKRIPDENRNFDPKAVAILLEAYGEVVTELGIQAADEKERAARFLIRVAQGQTELNAEKLRSATADALLNECAMDRRL